VRRGLCLVLLAACLWLSPGATPAARGAGPGPVQVLDASPPAAPAKAPKAPPAAAPSPAPVPADPDPALPDPGDMSVIMDFDNVDIRVFIKFISDLTGKNFVVGDDVRGNVTVISPKSMGPDEAFAVFESVLEVNGFTIVPSGGVFKVVSTKSGRTMNTALPRGVSEGGDRMITQILPLKYVQAAEIKAVLAPMVSPDGLLAEYQATDTLILIDYAANVRRLQGIVAEMDVPHARVTVFPLRHASAAKLAERLGKLWTGRAGGKEGAGRGPAVVPDERTNSIAVMAGPEETSQIARVIRELDEPPRREQGNVKVYTLQNANAEELAKVLNELAGRVAASAEKAEDGSQKARATAEGVRIVPDKGTNSILVTASPEDMVFFDDLIAKLDVPRQQVFVEAVIMEVSTDRNLSFGVNWAAAGLVKGVGDSGDGALVVGGFQPDGTVDSFVDDALTLPTGFSVGMVSFPVTIGEVTYANIQALISASKVDNKVNIISTPQLMTLDNEEASIVVAENRPFLTSTQTGTNELDRTVQQFEYKDVGTTLKVTPQINKGETIRLKIKQETSRVDAQETAETGVLQPTTRKRSTETTVLVRNTQTIVISGLIGEKDSDGENKVPVLGDIPVLGWLFKRKTTAAEKTNLLVFITPRIASAPAEINALYREKSGQMEQTIRDYNADVGRKTPPDAPRVTPPGRAAFDNEIDPIQKPLMSYGPALDN
jgi:general secretion pathway protein D